MRTTAGIFLRDLKALGRNPVALFVVLALLVLPGLYAWYCIVANWDPYAHTSHMPIAVVNEDKGARSDLTGKVNIGEQVVAKLADNDDIDWRFYDDKESALEDTRTGVFYATFVFPKDLSKSIVGIFEGSDKTPKLYYYPNEKRNAVAVKVTDSAAQSLIVQVNQEFSSTVNETLLTEAQKGVEEAESATKKARGTATNDIAAARKDLKATIELLDEASASIGDWRSSVSTIQDSLGETARQLPAIEDALEASSADLDKLRTKTSKFDSAFSQALAQANLTLANLSLRASSGIGSATADVAKASASLNEIIEQLKVMIELHGNIESIDQFLEKALTKLENASSKLDTSVENANKTVQDMNDSVQQLVDETTSASQSFSEDALPQLSAGTFELGKALSGLSSAVAQFEPQITELQGVLSQTDSALGEADDAIGQAKSLLTNVSKGLKSTVDDLGALGSALQLDQITKLLDIDPENLGTFASSPVEMVTEKIYPVSNYGTAVAPFYTCLALWIGCFILLSVIKLEIDSTGFEEATTKQRYFGRLALLVLLALLQSQIICGVDILLGIDCANPVAFMAAGAVCSFVFINLLYALVITFRNIGKTLCIVLLIMQIPGSSGMYPIEMMPGFFRGIHPLLPFTYGIDAMREALCGMHGADYFIDLLVLLGVLAVAFIIGLVIRPRALNVTQLFDEELNAAGFFESEKHGRGSDDTRVLSLFRALATNDSLRGSVEARATRFRKRYPIVRRAGSIALMAIPFVLLLVMLPLNVFMGVSTDVKIGALVFVLVALLVLQIGLILLEYANRTLATETKLLGLNAGKSGAVDAERAYTTIADRADDKRLAIEDRIVEIESSLSKAKHARLDAADAAVDQEVEGSASTNAPRKLHIGAARDIFYTDMRLGFQSVIGVVVIMLLVITPSLYAWFNIAGSWDPYSNTGNLKVAVANNDEGYKGDLIPMRVDIGNTIVSQLRANSGFDWIFVNKDEAIEGVYDERYYAAIVIPKDFSRDMMTYLIEDSDYPDVVYYTNEKENPIAPIITQKGANTIQEGIRSAFTERVDEIGLTVIEDLTDYVTSPNLTGYVEKMSKHLDDAVRDISDGASAMRTLSSLSSTASDVVSTANVALEGIEASGSTAKDALNTAEDGANDASKAFSKAASIVKKALSGSSDSLDGITDDVDAALVDLENNTTNVPDVLHVAAGILSEAASVMQDVAKAAQDAAEQEEDPETKEEALAEAARLEGIANSLTNLADAATSAADNSDGLTGNIESTRAELKELIDEAEASISEAQSFYDKSIESTEDDIEATMSSAVGAVRAIVDSLKNAVGGLSGNADSLTSQLDGLSGDLTNSADKLDKTAKSISDAKQRLTKALSSGDIKQLESVILGSDSSTMAARMAAPLEEIREPLYPVANFGSAMAPFYTVLCLWVGALVLVSTLQVHVAEERMEKLRRRYKHVRAFTEYAGRYGIFAFISLLQSLLVLLGDLCLLHIQCVNPILFVVFGVFIGQVFCLFVYTLSELFGDVGKALCVILLIMQVAASGGTFPVEMLDPLLSNIVPFLPFFHGMNLLKECVAGIYWPSVAGNVMFLLAMVGGVLLVGIVARKPFRKLDNWFEGQLEKTGYM